MRGKIRALKNVGALPLPLRSRPRAPRFLLPLVLDTASVAR